MSGLPTEAEFIEGLEKLDLAAEEQSAMAGRSFARPTISIREESYERWVNRIAQKANDPNS